MKTANAVVLAGVLLVGSPAEFGEVSVASVAPRVNAIWTRDYQLVFAPRAAIDAVDMGPFAAHSTSHGQFAEPGWWQAHLPST